MVVSVREARERRARDHHEALVRYYAAANEFASLYAAWAALLPKRDNVITRLKLGVQLWGREDLFVARMWQLTDALWEASARLRALATVNELEAVNVIEGVLAEWSWSVGAELPETWGPAIHRLRTLIEEL
jgi:hypothetical protein